MNALILFIGFISGGLLLLWYLTKKSPIGYEDETGFHFGIDTGCVQKNAVKQIQSTPKNEVITPIEESPGEAVDPVFPLPFPWLVKGLGLTALLVSLVVFPKVSRNTNPLTSQTEVTHPASANFASVEFNSDRKVILVASAYAEDSRFTQKLCARFSQVE